MATTGSYESAAETSTAIGEPAGRPWASNRWA